MMRKQKNEQIKKGLKKRLEAGGEWRTYRYVPSKNDPALKKSINTRKNKAAININTVKAVEAIKLNFYPYGVRQMMFKDIVKWLNENEFKTALGFNFKITSVRRIVKTYIE